MDDMKKSSRGRHFEMRVERRLLANFPECMILHDVIIPGRKGKPTQIDFVLLDETGIYVIEAKGYSGTVTGNASDVFWTKTYMRNDGSKDERLVMNPLVQNSGHVRYIEKLINDPSVPVHSIAVLSEKCDSSGISHSKSDSFMFHLKDFTTGIRGIMDVSEAKVTDSKLEEIERHLESSQSFQGN